MSLSFKSLTISLKPGEPTFKWDPSRKWTTESVGGFIAIRDREFEKLGKELKGKFDSTEDKAAMKSKLDLAFTQQDLAERIKGAMLAEHNFQMPEDHGEWYEVRWSEFAHLRGRDLWIHAYLRIKMRSQSVAGSFFPLHIESLSGEPLGFWYKDPPRELVDRQRPSPERPPYSGSSEPPGTVSQSVPDDTANSVGASVSIPQPSVETKHPPPSGMGESGTVFST
ncbi:hypothetical protein FFLO_06697 [Filobasidium floriforme]|uniref:Uncharacterized protein n=1 Tax=Filobasidium floriforme TaxID=5210 RepID=A0A8K0JEE8_9TREE|nr:hypothetical protein FFLO_06697 [Filobasidium floriforme]